MDYAIKFADQLKQHLRALRRAKGLTQAELASRMGVGQSRIADIEANPAAVSADQLLKLLSLLDVQLVLRDQARSSGAIAALPLPDEGKQPAVRKAAVRIDDKLRAGKIRAASELRQPTAGYGGPDKASTAPSSKKPAKTRKPKGSW